jgi:hypothetical protein
VLFRELNVETLTLFYHLLFLLPLLGEEVVQVSFRDVHSDEGSSPVLDEVHALQGQNHVIYLN